MRITASYPALSAALLLLPSAPSAAAAFSVTGGGGGGGGGRARTLPPPRGAAAAPAHLGSAPPDVPDEYVGDDARIGGGYERERLLRRRIERKNTLTEGEGRYGIIDGDGTDDADEQTGVIVKVRGEAETARVGDGGEEAPRAAAAAAAAAATAAGALRRKIDRAVKPRAYPLFLMEKGAQIFEDAIGGILPERSDSASERAVSTTVADGAPKLGPKTTKERLVVLGTGWGATAFLKDIDTVRYDVTVVSPRNFFLFTPMLAGASVGTVEYRSITEPIREINPKARYLEATATAIDPKARTVSCESVVCEGSSCDIEDFTVPYDKLLLTVGAQTNTFGIPGVREHCCFLKQVEDARRIRTAIVNCFERANLPALTDEERAATLTFAVIGAGPTGIEFASELRDFIETDGPKYYPDLLKFVSIKVIEASPTILAPFDESLKAEAIRQLERPPAIKDPAVANLLPESFKLTELLLNSGVKEVKETSISLNTGEEIPYGLAVWAAGNGPLPITLQLIDALSREDGSEQANAQSVARGRLAVDPWLRVLGGDGTILALGDCSCVMSGQLPATAQVAGQQGEYLGRLLSRGYDFAPGTDPEEGILLPPERDPNRRPSASESIAAFACQADDFAAPFQFLNLGILAYTGGGSALAQLQVTPDERGRVKGKGKVGFGLWRSVYLSKQVSWRNRFLVFVDWTKARIFGRDITRI